MSGYIVSARKYRPDTFRSVIGQPTITSTLKNAIRTHHVAQAYLFCGPRGVGKTTCARILSRTLNCLSPTADTEACGQCESCVAFAEQRSYNIHELDAASNNSVEDIRTLIDKVRIPPQIGKYSIYIIDEVHMLSAQAFNAFLKTLEEPPAHAIFILATTEKHKIIPTILSRCQVFDFRRIGIDHMVEYLVWLAQQEGVKAEKTALNIIAGKSDGAMRDALSIFDQLVSFTGSDLSYQSVIEHLNVLDYDYFFQLTDTFLSGDTGNALVIFDRILSRGFNGHFFLDGLSSHFRDLLVAKDEITLPLLEVGDEIRERYKEQSRRCAPLFLLEALQVCSTADVGYKASRNQRLHVELALLQLCRVGGEKKNGSSPVAAAAGQPSKPAGTFTPSRAEVPPVVTAAPKPLTPASASVSASSSVSSSASVSAGPSMPSIKDALSKAQTTRTIRSAGASLSIQESVTVGNTSADVTDDKAGLGQPASEGCITASQLEAAWPEIARSFEVENPRIFSALSEQVPKLGEGALICLEVNSIFVKEALEKATPAILHAIAARLGKGIKHLDIHVNNTPQQGKSRCYTDEERFAYLAAKNPDMMLLKQTFHLDYL
ncbi:MAG: DNA polymerase III subunit gamma/tau [Bacteroidales bacterium]